MLRLYLTCSKESETHQVYSSEIEPETLESLGNTEYGDIEFGQKVNAYYFLVQQYLSSEEFRGEMDSIIEAGKEKASLLYKSRGEKKEVLEQAKDIEKQIANTNDVDEQEDLRLKKIQQEKKAKKKRTRT